MTVKGKGIYQQKLPPLLGQMKECFCWLTSQEGSSEFWKKDKLDMRQNQGWGWEGLGKQLGCGEWGMLSQAKEEQGHVW